MQVTRATFIPILASGNNPNFDAGAVREEYCADLTLVYSLGPPFGRRVVTHADMEQMELTPRTLRRSAFEQLEMLARDRAQFHGQPPSVMLSFDGLESSLLLATEFWSRLQGALPGELVVGVPARDVVIVTGSQLPQGLEKVRRAVDRVFFAGDENLLTRTLLVRRGGTWEPFDRPARQGSRPGAHPHSADRAPRQYQEHPSWPGERVPVASAMPADLPVERPAPTGRPAPSPVPLLPAAAANVPRPAATSLPPPRVPTPPPATGPRPGSMAPQGLPPMTPQGLPSRTPSPMSRPGPMMPTSPPTGAIRPIGGSPMSAAGPMSGVGALPPVSGGVPRGGSPVGGAGPLGGPRPGSHAARLPDPPRPAERVRPADQARVADSAQYSAAPYSAAPYSAAPYSAVPQSAVPYSAMPYSALPSSAIPSSAIPSSAMPNSAVPSSAVPYSATPYSGARSSAPVSPGYPQPAFSRGARSHQPKPPYRDDPYPTSGGSYSSYRPVSPAPYPASAPPSAPRVSPPPYGARPSYSGPGYGASGPGYEPNPPYQGHSSRDYERDAPGYPSWSETSANDTFSGLFARGETTGRQGFDGRSGPRARFTR